jgi:hypothetical protein
MQVKYYVLPTTNTHVFVRRAFIARTLRGTRSNQMCTTRGKFIGRGVFYVPTFTCLYYIHCNCLWYCVTIPLHTNTRALYGHCSCIIISYVPTVTTVRACRVMRKWIAYECVSKIIYGGTAREFEPEHTFTRATGIDEFSVRNNRRLYFTVYVRVTTVSVKKIFPSTRTDIEILT